MSMRAMSSRSAAFSWCLGAVRRLKARGPDEGDRKEGSSPKCWPERAATPDEASDSPASVVGAAFELAVESTPVGGGCSSASASSSPTSSAGIARRRDSPRGRRRGGFGMPWRRMQRPRHRGHANESPRGVLQGVERNDDSVAAEDADAVKEVEFNMIVSPAPDVAASGARANEQQAPVGGDFGGTFAIQAAGTIDLRSSSAMPALQSPAEALASTADFSTTLNLAALEPARLDGAPWVDVNVPSRWPSPVHMEAEVPPWLGIEAVTPAHARSPSPASTVSVRSRSSPQLSSQLPLPMLPPSIMANFSGPRGMDAWQDGMVLPGSMPPSSMELPVVRPELFVLYASPVGPQLPRAIDVQAELELLSQVVEESQAGWRVRVGVATADTLMQLLTRARAGGRFLVHVVAHCDNHPTEGVGLVLEDGCGGPHVLYKDKLGEMLRANGGLDQLPLLFLNTCWSEAIATLFAECGCRQLVFTQGPVLDAAARQFAQQFYFSLGSREPLGQAWESARQALKIDPRPEVQQNADKFVLKCSGGQGSDSSTGESANVEALCRLDGIAVAHQAWRPGRGWEDAESVLEVPDLPPRVEDFVGRGWALRDLLRILGGAGAGPSTAAKRACVLFGPSGIGKTAAAVELAHFAAAPGRLFSRLVVHVRFGSGDFEDEEAAPKALADAVADALERLLAKLGARGGERDGERSSERGGGSGADRSLPSDRARASSGERTRTPSPQRWPAPAGNPDLALAPTGPINLKERRLYTAGRLLEEACRPKRRALLIVDDEAGILHRSADAQRCIGGLLQATRRLSVLCVSRQPIYQPLGQHRCENYSLGPLTDAEAARIFLRRRNRPFHPVDFRQTAPPQAGMAGGRQVLSEMAEGSTISPFPQSWDELHKTITEHPVLVSLAGHPGRVRAAAAKVTPHLRSLFDLSNFSSSALPGEQS
mmetsp:Transcript_84216/g.180468  ORF Transcript_84216/g.180468 Transcript_84216/m.180468 type:complete len:939 (-) Transcript_84216:90-2906(-)